MLKDLLGTCQTQRSGRFELQECLAAVLRVIRSVNDSLHRVNITNLPSLLDPLGSLVCQVCCYNSNDGFKLKMASLSTVNFIEFKFTGNVHSFD